MFSLTIPVGDYFGGGVGDKAGSAVVDLTFHVGKPDSVDEFHDGAHLVLVDLTLQIVGEEGTRIDRYDRSFMKESPIGEEGVSGASGEDQPHREKSPFGSNLKDRCVGIGRHFRP